ncbi:MAG: hypothetical protein INR71_02240 [Terriglobus roseus]|nr:hypothetical protein [Terriglobus roseus]
MKIILAGATGDVGTAVLKRCIADSRVSRVTALTLHELPKELAAHPKVSVLKQNDYTNISDGQMFRLKDAEACIWYVACSLFCYCGARVTKSSLCVSC